MIHCQHVLLVCWCTCVQSRWLLLMVAQCCTCCHWHVVAGDSEVQRTMLELLNQLDGFEPKQNIKVCERTSWFISVQFIDHDDVWPWLDTYVHCWCWQDVSHLKWGYRGGSPPPFRPSEPALCGSCSLVTPCYCRLGDLLCFMYVYRYSCLLLSMHVCFLLFPLFDLSFVDFFFST